MLVVSGGGTYATITLGEYQTWERKSMNFTLEEKTAINGFGFELISGTGDVKFKNIQLERGNSSTEYIPYEKHSITINIDAPNDWKTYSIYLNEPLRKVGDYEDYIDFNTMEVVRKIKTQKISDLSWTQGSSIGNLYRYESSTELTDKLYTNSYSTNLLCSDLQVVPYTNNTTDYSIAERHNFNFLRILSSDLETTDEMLNKIGDASIYYVLETPEREPIELSTIELYQGTNVLKVDSKVAPSKIEVSHILETQ